LPAKNVNAIEGDWRDVLEGVINQMDAYQGEKEYKDRAQPIAIWLLADAQLEKNGIEGPISNREKASLTSKPTRNLSWPWIFFRGPARTALPHFPRRIFHVGMLCALTRVGVGNWRSRGTSFHETASSCDGAMAGFRLKMRIFSRRRAGN
jgi:hypothetical protein